MQALARGEGTAAVGRVRTAGRVYRGSALKGVARAAGGVGRCVQGRRTARAAAGHADVCVDWAGRALKLDWAGHAEAAGR